MPIFIMLSDDIWVNVADIVYVRPQAFERSYVELRNGSGFEDSRSPSALLSAISTSSWGR